MEVRELEHRPATTCPMGTSIGEAARLMSNDNVGSIIVLDSAGRIAGIVTDRDIVVRGVARGVASSALIEEVMTSHVIFLYEHADVFAAASEMAENGCRRLPVLDSKGRLTGLVSFDDLFVLLSDQSARLGRAIRMEIMSKARV